MSSHSDHNHDADAVSGITLTCDSHPFGLMGYEGRASSWGNHFFAGFLLLFWALHWNISIFKKYLTSSKQTPYTAQTTFQVWGFNVSWSVEGVLKIVLPFIGILYQLLGQGSWSSNVCAPGTAREGHFNVNNIHSWENSWILFCYMVAGMVDVASQYLDLPPSTQHFFTAAAFGLNAFMLNQGTYVDMLDEMCYYLMFLTAATTCISMLVEIATPDSLWAGCTRVYSTWMQAIWYFACARVLYESRPNWDTMKPVPDMGPAMYLPVVYVMWMNFLSLAMLGLYLGMRWWYGAHLNDHLRNSCSVERTLIANDGICRVNMPKDMRKEAATHELTPLVGGKTGGRPYGY